jgi:thiamine pyrophosphate-dependent acetolactate synthase large subunit-like protein
MEMLLDAVRSQTNRSMQRQRDERRKVLEERYQARLKRDRQRAALAWNSSPVTTARLTMETMHAVRDLDWVLSSLNWTVNNWPKRLCAINKPYRSSASIGAGGLGDGMARAIGTALFHRKHGRIVVNIQPDGDLMFTPGALWTAAHHELPILTVVHNNRAYHQEVMELQVIANQRDRNVQGERIGCMLSEPPIDFARMAQSMGVWAEGPIENPDDLGPALRRAVAVVADGRPALVDVVSEPR